jgi:hypothetical protein
MILRLNPYRADHSRTCAPVHAVVEHLDIVRSPPIIPTPLDKQALCCGG